ncbi:MAG TPA: zf-HC2 domain-containing protein [Candidatus Binatia bacterium]|nr:zf-HC2 domain-containing protein [Candidatus Binatia bacterium]
MTCQEFNAFVLAYLADELPAAERSAFEAHLGECPECVEFLKSYRQTIELEKGSFPPGSNGVAGGVPERLVRAILAARPKK